MLECCRNAFSARLLSPVSAALVPVGRDGRGQECLVKFLIGADPVPWHTSPGPPHPRWVQAGGRGAGGASGAVLSPGQPGRGGQTPSAVQVLAAALRTMGGKKKYIIPVATATSSSCLPQTSEPTQKEPLSPSPLPAWVPPPCRLGVFEHPGAQKPACTPK